MSKPSHFCLPLASRSALTLIEMLVGMAITLVMMAAVVNLFANISTSVNNRQGAMEISAELRIARQRLYNDLAGATVRTDDVGEPNGYFESVDGIASDGPPPPGSVVRLGPPVSLIPSSNMVADAEGNLFDPAVVTDFSGLGDFDDILAFTVESKGAPFRGRGRALIPGANPNLPMSWIGTTIESRFAEVIWFAVENPADGSRGEPGMRTIYRRVLLIAPWVTTYDIPVGPTGQLDPIFDLTNTNFHPNTELPFFYPGLSIANTYEAQVREMLNFQNEYDISVRLENGRIVPNTLADLARREHRFAHLPDNLTGNVRKFPHPICYDIISRDPSIHHLLPGAVDNSQNPISSLQPLSGDRAGGDIVLTNVLAFDVLAFDPGAPLYNYQGTVLHPSPVQAFQNAVSAGPSFITGFGTYVDLGWNDNLDYDYQSVRSMIPSAPAPLFQVERKVGWVPALSDHPYFREPPVVYDTWTNYYETDQIDQESSPFYQSILPTSGWLAGQTPNIDQGTNGLDDQAYYDDDNNPNTPPVADIRNGPDDVNERETSPPYPVPLKGVQVKLRIYEPNSRSIREANVTRKMAE